MIWESSHRRTQEMMQGNSWDIHGIWHPLLIILQPRTFAAKRIASTCLSWDDFRRVSPGTLRFSREKSLDGALHGLATFQHDQMTGNPDIGFLGRGNRSGDLLKTGAFKDRVAVAADHQGWYLQGLELLPAIPFCHVLKVKLFEYMRRREQPFLCKWGYQPQHRDRQTQRQL